MTRENSLSSAPASEAVDVVESSAEEWEAKSDEVADSPESERPPEEPDILIDLYSAERVAGIKQEREKIGIDFVEQAYEQSKKEITERYGINESGDNSVRLTRFIKAIFAHEYKDLEVSRKIAEGTPEEQAKELKKSFRLLGKEGALRLSKVVAKTGVAGGIGAGIVAILGGTIASPVFLAALAGGAAARGAFELYRHYKSDEREGRTKVIESRSKVFAEAAKMQSQAEALAAERETSDKGRIAEIDKELAGLHKYFVDLAHYESYQSLYADDMNEKELTGLAETSKLGHEKMRLEKKREKIADLVAAGGSLIGGLVGNVVQTSLMNADIDKVRGIWADFDKDGIRHFVEKINPQDIASADPGFADQLKETGGYVFNYNEGAIAEHGIEKAAQVTTAVLNNGNEVHVISGLNDSIFRDLASKSPEMAEKAASLAGSFWKEAVPLAGANLLMAAEFFTSRKNRGDSESLTPPPVIDPGNGEISTPPRNNLEVEISHEPRGDNKPETKGSPPSATAEKKEDKGNIPVNVELAEDADKIYLFASEKFSNDYLSSKGLVLSKAPSSDGREVTTMVLKAGENSLKSIKIVHPRREYDQEGRSLPIVPDIIIGRTVKRTKDNPEGWKRTKNPGEKEVDNFLNEIINKVESMSNEAEQEKRVPITVNGEKNDPEKITEETETEEADSKKDKELGIFELLVESGKEPGDFMEGKNITFSDKADESPLANELKEHLNIPKLAGLDVMVVLNKAVGDDEATDFNTTLMYKSKDGEEYAHTLSLRELIKIID